jgi:hypothetical protein
MKVAPANAIDIEACVEKKLESIVLGMEYKRSDGFKTYGRGSYQNKLRIFFSIRQIKTLIVIFKAVL